MTDIDLPAANATLGFEVDGNLTLNSAAENNTSELTEVFTTISPTLSTVLAESSSSLLLAVLFSTTKLDNEELTQTPASDTTVRGTLENTPTTIETTPEATPEVTILEESALDSPPVTNIPGRKTVGLLRPFLRSSTAVGMTSTEATQPSSPTAVMEISLTQASRPVTSSTPAPYNSSAVTLLLEESQKPGEPDSEGHNQPKTQMSPENLTVSTSVELITDSYNFTGNLSAWNTTTWSNVSDNLVLSSGTPGIDWSASKVLLFLFQLFIMIETVVGNFLVILSVKVEKKLQTPFNYYIVNLAFTDMNVGMSVMSLFLVYNLYDYFPFNDYLCNYWIWSDYTMTFESVMTLAAISIDRFWSVTWTLHYRNHNSGRKSLYIILMTWALVSCIWLPAFIYDRIVHEYAPGDCFWDSEKNKKLVLYVGFLGYYSPLFIMLGAYTRIFYVMKKRAAQVKAQTKKTEVTAQASNPAETSEAQSSAEGGAPGGGTSDQKKLVQQPQKSKKDDVQDAKLRREQKAVYTLLNIVVIFLICWIPFYILFVISAWFPTFFPTWYINFSYWMAYINSAVNPVLYPLSSAEFRSAYKKIFKMVLCQK